MKESELKQIKDIFDKVNKDKLLKYYFLQESGDFRHKFVVKCLKAGL